MVNSKLLSPLVIVCFFLSCNSNEGLKFYPLPPSKNFTDNDSIRKRVDYFVVKNLELDNKNKIAEVDSFVLEHLPNDLEKYSSYQMLFFKYNRRINENYIHNEEILIEWESEFVQLEYTWTYGKFSYLSLNPYSKDSKAIFSPRWK